MIHTRLINNNEYIEDNNCGEVTSVELFLPGSNEPDPRGLVSYEIFGVPGTPERKTKYGWIRLNHIFIAPHALKEMKRIYTSSFNDFLAGNETYGITLDSRELEKVREKGVYLSTGTGIKWLYDNWDSIVWKDRAMCSKSTSNSRRFFKILSKDTIFIDKWIIIPAFYRDVDTRTQKRNEINKMYTSLMGAASSLKTMLQSFGEDGSKSLIFRLQNLIEGIYDYFMGVVGGNNGFINEHVIGKNTDYASRMVITASDINSETVEEMETDFTHSAIPLHAVIKSFAPFIIFGFVDFIQSIIRGSNYAFVMKDGHIERVELSPYWTELITRDNISKIMDRYVVERSFRLEYVMIETVEGKYPLCVKVSGRIPEDTDADWRPITYCELFYIIAETNVSDKHAYVTRYPVEDQNSVYPTKINIIPSSKYGPKYGFPRYPKVDVADKTKLDYFFVDSFRISPLYLNSLGADFDGDQVNFQGVFTKEANEDADRQIHSIANFIGIDGEPIRVFKLFGGLALYTLTLKPEDM